MKYLVATTETQGMTEGDFAWARPGEVVHLPVFVCHAWDGPCGCGRSFCGVDSHKATTTAVVVDDPAMTIDRLQASVLRSLADGGWGDDPDLLFACLDPILDVVDGLDVGTVLGFRVEGTDDDPVPPVQSFRNRSIEDLIHRIEASAPGGRRQ
ncbi:MAG: DUF7715 family protein [Aquihabitans sp.]